MTTRMKLFSALAAVMAMTALAPAAQADSLFADPSKGPTLNQLYKHSKLPHHYVDFSMFHYVPRGDRITVQPERDRLVFNKKTGEPDGYAERRGDAVIYYNPAGKAIRVQRLTPEEMDRLTSGQ
ncbi:hypothetical protein E3E12_03755 [Formicincola oecophyllae]|uniref:Uncharacterized protein n=1 Tax=Formicincola oecophyllae TaxID=2558361 RepID=A0A4Y6UAP3_9PROT|nr:hypothetical protein [Formicincola oecophyllae]QDH13461.1 hypothetical protein E3E12_03755 [Formicincola oecophyllae]